MIDFYEKSGKVIRIDANREIELIAKDVEMQMDSLGIFPKWS